MISIQKHIISEAFEQLSKSVKLNESKLSERYSFPEVDDALNHFWNDLGKDPEVDDVIGFLEDEYPDWVPTNPEDYGRWYHDVAGEISARLSESKLTEAPMDVKDYAAKLRARKAEKGQNPLEKINSQIDPDMSITDQLQVYFDELVPASGPAKTVAGELVRAIMRILYRDYNDGDLWYTGYGKETCGDSVVYLIEHIEDLQDLFEDMIYKEMEDAEYTDALEDVASRVMVYLNEHPELFTTPLDKDSRSGADLESYFDLPTYEFEPDTSYDDSYYDVSDDDIDEFIHDIVESDFRGATVNRWARDGWTIEGLDKEQLEYLEDVWEKWFNDFLSQYEREEEPEEDYEDEDATAEADWDDSTDSEFDESLSLSKLHYRQLAHDPSTDPDTLAELAKDKDTRLAVAKNPSTSFETLLKLSKSRDPEVKKAALAGLDSYYFQITGNDDEFGWTDADFDESLKEKIDDDRFKRSMLTQKIFYEYPDISEDDEDYLNSLSYDALVKECKNRGWEDLLKDFDESLNKDNQKRGRKMKIVAEDFQECNLNKMGTNEYEANTNRQKHINMYRKFANLNDDEVITEDMIDDYALDRTACLCNREPERIKAEILGQRYSEYEQ